MRYYQYISDTKIDMLLPQVPYAFKQKVSGEVGFDIKILSGKIKTQTSTLDDRVSRLATVENHIMLTQPVGTVQKPDIWIKGTLKMAFGYLGPDTKVVGFSGKDKGVSLLLAGSSAHVVGASPTDAEIGRGFSFLPRLLKYLEEATRMSDEAGGAESDKVAKLLGGHSGDSKQQNWLTLIRHGARDALETVEIEFLAKRLMETGEIGKMAILATPLFVAMVN
jgi:hypothetical protein